MTDQPHRLAPGCGRFAAGGPGPVETRLSPSLDEEAWVNARSGGYSLVGMPGRAHHAEGEAMTVKELARMVRDARDLQRAYFRVRSQTALEASKAAERALDAAVAEILDPPTLFGDSR